MSPDEQFRVNIPENFRILWVFGLSWKSRMTIDECQLKKTTARLPATRWRHCWRISWERREPAAESWSSWRDYERDWAWRRAHRKGAPWLRTCDLSAPTWPGSDAGSWLAPRWLERPATRWPRCWREPEMGQRKHKGRTRAGRKERGKKIQDRKWERKRLSNIERRKAS